MQNLARIGRLTGVLMLASLAGCTPRRDEGPSSRPRDADRPTADKPADAGETGSPDRAHAEPETTPAPSVTTMPPEPPPRPPVEPPPAEPPKSSDFVTVLERYRTDSSFATNSQVEPPRRLRVDTDNVRRLRIDRRRVPLTRDGSLSLVLDGQGFEWGERTTVLTLERTPAGAWTVVPEPAR
jgi:hypothetical protein